LTGQWGFVRCSRTELEKNNSTKEERRMKKLSIVVAALLVAGAVSSWAAESDKIVAGPVPITLSGKLSGTTVAKGSTKVDGSSINGVALEMAEVQVVGDDANSLSGTDAVTFVIGSSLGTSNIVSGGVTNTFLVGTAVWFGEDSVETKASKSGSTSLIGFGEAQIDLFTDNDVTNAHSVISNSFLAATVSFKVSKTSTNVSGKVLGIWKDGVSAFSGTIKTTKTK